jgi:hypothetical protein
MSTWSPHAPQPRQTILVIIDQQERMFSDIGNRAEIPMFEGATSGGEDHWRPCSNSWGLPGVKFMRTDEIAEIATNASHTTQPWIALPSGHSPAAPAARPDASNARPPRTLSDVCG